jgi:hypothetical protein
MRTPKALVADVSADESAARDAATTFVLPAYEAPKPAGGSCPEMIDRLAEQFGCRSSWRTR